MASKEVQLGVEEWRDGELVGCWKQNSSLSEEVRATKTKRSQKRRGWWWWQSVLLPEGYPESVSEDYAVYQAWDTVQALCSSITGFLCTRALLQGVGVGDVSATPGAAAVQWALRDGAGMVGRIGFAWLQARLMMESTIGSELDNNAKTWRLMADILNDIGMTLELLSPLFPPYFFALACAGSFCKAIVGVAGGATRAAITMHQARADNMADVAAKDGSQETAVSLVGLILGLIIAPLVDNNYVLIWLLFAVFTAAHLFANYRAVRGLVMDTLNRQRLAIVVDHYLNSASGEVLSPVQTSAREWPLWWVFMESGSAIRLGSSLAALLPRLGLSSSSSRIDALAHLASRSHLACVCLADGSAVLLPPNGADQPAYGDEDNAECSLAGRPSIEVLLRQDVDHSAMIEAFAAALIARRTLSEMTQKQQTRESGLTRRRLAAAVRSEQARLLPPLVAALSASGWHTTRSLLGPGPYRYRASTSNASS